MHLPPTNLNKMTNDCAPQSNSPCTSNQHNTKHKWLKRITPRNWNLNRHGSLQLCRTPRSSPLNFPLSCVCASIVTSLWSGTIFESLETNPSLYPPMIYIGGIVRGNGSSHLRQVCLLRVAPTFQGFSGGCTANRLQEEIRWYPLGTKNNIASWANMGNGTRVGFIDGTRIKILHKRVG